jgi:hypothetical protein
MNAPLLMPETAASLGDIDDFTECCQVHAWYYAEGWISLQTAVDNLQNLAERWALIAEIGQDAVQELIAASFDHFGALPTVADVLTEYDRLEIARRIERWEAADAKRARVPSMPVRCSNQPASSTIAAFKYVVALGNAVHLAKWLSDHAADAPALLELLEKAA